MPTYIYGDEEARYYPYPPFARTFSPGDEVDLDADQVPRDGRFWLKGPDGERLPLPPLDATQTAAAIDADTGDQEAAAETDPAPPAATKTTKTSSAKTKE